MWKGYAKYEQITLNVKNDRSGKCEINLNAKCEKSLVSWLDDQSDGQFGQIRRENREHWMLAACILRQSDKMVILLLFL